MGNAALNNIFAIKSKYINMLVKGCQGKTIILYKHLINNFYATSFYIN